MGMQEGVVLLVVMSIAMWANVMGLPLVYNTSSGPMAGKLNVHLVPHTHDDVGWLKTVDQYYTGSNNSIQNAAVHLILDNVITALQEDSNRKFIYVEQAFFQRWWREQTPKKQKVVKKLVKAGQLEFINGGWCMHDEATTHYIDMIDQTTLGHRYIKEQFGEIPRIGWQIDPFGHSAVQGYLLSAELGFDALYFARIDYQDKRKRLNESAMEMIWQASKTFGSSSQIFTGAFYDFYGPPAGFDFDMDSTDTPIQDDPMLFDLNVQERVEAFVAYAQTQASHIRTNHIMWTMGMDFNYQNAHGWFKQMDKFVNWVNLDGRVNAFYSTPSIYTDAKYAANESWPLKQDDFFPYADCPHCYWTGYFTSRPALKGYVRMLSGYYMMARQLEFFVTRRPNGLNTDALGDAMGISQHHDAVSGTEKQHTANDYAKRLSIASSEAMKVVNFALGCLVEGSRKGICQYTNTSFHQCPLLNVSYCPISESSNEKNGTLVVVAYNALGWNRTEYIRIPVNRKYVQVTDSLGVSVPSQLLPISNITKELRSKYVQAYLGVSPGAVPAYWLVFPATVPAFGYNTYIVTDSDGKGAASMSSIEVLPRRGAVTVGHDTLQLRLAENGLISEMADTKARVQGKLYLHVNPSNEGSRWRRSMGQQVYSPLQLAFTTLGEGESWIHAHFPSFSGMSMDYNLPENVALITLQELNDGHTLLRLAHLYQADEDAELSTKAYVDLKKVFPNQQIQKMQEMNLSANQEKAAMMKARRKWKVSGGGGGEGQAGGSPRGGPVNPSELMVELGPMEIRTFVLTFG